MDLITLITFILICGSPFVFGTIILVVYNWANKKSQSNPKGDLYDLEILEKNISETDFNVEGIRMEVGRIIKYKAKYWTGKECVAEFERTGDAKEYEVGDRFWGYVSPNGYVQELSNSSNGNEKDFRKGLAYGIAGISYAVGILIILPFLVPNIHEYFPLYFIFGPMLLCGMILNVSGICILVKSWQFHRKKKHYYNKIPATVESLEEKSKGIFGMYCPVFSYDLYGERKTYRSRVAWNFTRYSVGDQAVLYQDPKTEKIEERGLVYILVAVICFVLGGMVSFIPLLIILLAILY